MQYSPKLKMAMEKIKAIIEENDIAAFVVLHTPGFSEYLNAVSPSYSCAKVMEKGIHFKLKTAEVGKERAQELAQGTGDMITAFSDIIGRHALLYIDAFDGLSKHMDIDINSSDHTGHEQQNN